LETHQNETEKLNLQF